MAGDWIEVAINDIANIVGGSTPSTREATYFDGDIPWITPKDLSAEHPRYLHRGARNISQAGLDNCSAKLLPANAVLLSTRAPVGYVAIAANPVATNQGFRSLITKPSFDHEFIYYWLRANTEELERHASGSTFKELSGTALRQIRLRVPRDRTEQRAISRILGALDDKIELNRRMSETLEATARALFKSWFVDFDPVRAKAEGARSGVDEADRGLVSGVVCGFGAWCDSEKLDASDNQGRCPRAFGRHTVEIECVAVVRTVPWISAKTMTAIHADCPESYVASAAVGNGTRLAPDRAVFVMVRGMGLHKHVRVSQARSETAFNQDVKAIVPRDIDAPLLLFGLLHAQARLLTLVTPSGHGTGVLDTDVLLATEVVMPPSGPVRAWATSFFDAFNERIAVARTTSRSLSAIRDTLLPKLISGELRVKDAERFVGAAV